MRNTQVSNTDAGKLLLAARVLLGRVRLMVDASVEGVVIPVAPAAGEIAVEFSLIAPELNVSDAGISVISTFWDATCRCFIPWHSVRNAELVLAPIAAAAKTMRHVDVND